MRRSNAADRTMVTINDPRHPSRFEKKTNTNGVRDQSAVSIPRRVAGMEPCGPGRRRLRSIALSWPGQCWH
jgi:hypothetical protein